eukprot:scpid99757/ scgid1250/ E3 ubiquitin-protein ligase NRDP1; RING finger protein 41
MNNNYLLMCGICSLFVDAALETPCCKHLFCAKCISCWLEQSTKYPHCKDALCLDNLVSPHTIVADIIKQSVLKCDFYEAPQIGCPVQVRLCDLKSHVENCSHNPSTPSTPIQRVVSESSTIGDVLAASHSMLSGKVFDALTKRVVESSAEGDRLEVRGGGGSPAVWTRTPVTRVSSTDCSGRTARRRSSMTSSFTHSVCGGVGGMYNVV